MTFEDFNTSHVNVNHRTLGTALSSGGNFNTSHVNVNQISQCVSHLNNIYFNTSHVNVNRAGLMPTIVKSAFQYISC